MGRLLRNEVYAGTLHQLRYRKTEPEKRKTSPAGLKTGPVLRPREEWASLPVEPLVSMEVFQAVHTRLEKNREWASRNIRHEYLLAGILFCGYCGGRMGGHRGRDVAYYPGEQHRLVEDYRKNLYPDFMVREEMARMQQEQAGLDKRKVELEKRLSLLTMGQSQEEQVRAMVSRIGKGLDTMGFAQQQDLLRLLVEKVYYRGTELEISTIIPLEGEKYQLYPAPREGARG